MVEIFLNTEKYTHGTNQKIGVLITNLGTPDRPDKKAVKIYLKEFLEDHRIVEVPKIIWFFILNFRILLTRPKKTARMYSGIWTKEGSPLLSISKLQKQKIQKKLDQYAKGKYQVELGMRYGNPSIKSALLKLKKQNSAEKILVLPLYPQYCASTTASTFDAIVTETLKWRWIPEFRFINNYFQEEEYINALCNSIKNHWKNNGRNQRLQFSFHGTPVSNNIKGDPYACLCKMSARLIANRLGIKDEQWGISYQSRFGNKVWLQPYTDKTMQLLPKQGIKSVDVICPGFSTDCLETIEEIKEENKKYFLEAGGKKFSYIPCLNDSKQHITALTKIALKHLSNWGTLPMSDFDYWSVKDVENIPQYYKKINNL